MKLFACAATLALLAACGGSNMDMTPATPRAPTLSDLYGDVSQLQGEVNRITAQTPTSARNMPTSGTSTFRGGAIVVANRGATEYNLIGDSALTVNFGTGQMSGQASGFRGFDNRGVTFAAPGQITYSGGQIGVGGVPSAFSLSYRGSLDAGGDRVALSGNATGAFGGNRTNGTIRTRSILGVSGTSGSLTVQSGGTPNMVATVNDAPAVADFSFFGQN